MAVLVLLSTAVELQLIDLAQGNFFSDPRHDLPRIYIRSDGTVDPATAPVERTGNHYRLTEDIALCTIEIQCDNIVLDGSGHMISGNASWIAPGGLYDPGNNGVLLNGRSNVTVMRIVPAQCYAGIRVAKSSDITLVNNTFINGTTIGVAIRDSSDVLVEANSFTSIYGPAVSCNGTSNTITRNCLTGGSWGIEVEGSSNVVSENTIEVVLPIILDRADSNLIAKNNISGPAPSPQMPDRNFTGNEGIGLFVSSNNVIFGNHITGFVNQAIRTVFTCSNNTFYGNYIANCGFAAALQQGAVNNMFYGNTFAADSCKVQIDNGVDSTFWDNGTIGNCWGDYNGTDSNGNGIGDTPYTVKGYKWDTDTDGFVRSISETDNYPLVLPFDVENNGVQPPPATASPTAPATPPSTSAATQEKEDSSAPFNVNFITIVVVVVAAAAIATAIVMLRKLLLSSHG
ncbi:MAG: nitrous oxide reductase family maturation protein NosD [Candidatus Bathyarchaeia archaeon]